MRRRMKLSLQPELVCASDGGWSYRVLVMPHGNEFYRGWIRGSKKDVLKQLEKEVKKVEKRCRRGGSLGDWQERARRGSFTLVQQEEGS